MAPLCGWDLGDEENNPLPSLPMKWACLDTQLQRGWQTGTTTGMVAIRSQELLDRQCCYKLMGFEVCSLDQVLKPG